MLKLYTCYKCCFPFKADEGHVPPRCPACNCTPEWFLSEPYNAEERRRIHVDEPEPDEEKRDPADISYHVAKKFPTGSRNGQLRRFVFQYTNATEVKGKYEKLFHWDMIECEDADADSPLLYCATGPGTAEWDAGVPSFIYGYFRDKRSDVTGKAPLFMIEVDSIEETVKKAEEFGGKLLRPKYTEDKKQYAIIEDSEGNALYLWETPVHSSMISESEN